MSEDGYRRTMTMNWDGLGDEDDDDHFFESHERMSSAIAMDLASSGSDDDDEDFDDSRMSFASAVSSASYFSRMATSTNISQDYNIWLAEPGSITERRNRLLHGMGLTDKDLVAEIKRVVSKKVGNHTVSSLVVETPTPANEQTKGETETQQVNMSPVILVRSRSDGDIDFQPIARRKEEFFGTTSKQHLTRTLSNNAGPCVPACRYQDAIRVSPKGGNSSPFHQRRNMSSQMSSNRFGAFFLIKNLDTGKEFIVNEYDNQGMWNRFSDLQTGKQLTMEEFEKSVGFSPVVKELMRRENVSRMTGNNERKLSALSKSLRMSKRSGAALLKNIKGVANSMSGLIGDKERENQQAQEQKNSKNSSEWIKVRQHGKSYKELTALHMCQEIQAHEGSVWTMKFSLDAHYLASAGEDRIIHIWEVQDCEVMSFRQPDEWSWTPLHQSAFNTPDRQFPTDVTSSPAPTPTPPSEPTEKKKKGKGSQNTKKGVPDYVHVPETVFSLSEKPICSFKGHLDDVLDLSWSRSQLLLSSSMDKTVRLWDLETKSCLKLFAHNDYVTCIQFNPMDDNYFISGSLDAKVRIWNISDRQVVDWIDFHEMVTAICYTPDGQGAVVGSHKGTCRMYSIEDCKLEQISQLDIQNKKKSARKVTGLQFAPWNPSELLITSADSRIRIMDGLNMTQKFRGFRNTSSQIAASYTPNGRHVISASEDSQVYVWKRSMPRNGSNGKGKGIVSTGSYEHFQCRDVSVAIPWPGTIKGDPPAVPIHSKRHSKRITQPPVSGNTTQDECLLGGSKRQLPPLPKKKETTVETTPTPPEEELARLSRLDSGEGMGESFNSASGSSRYGDSPSISSSPNPSSASWSSPWSLFDGGNSNGSGFVQATAWGMVIVTAGLGGEIRAYQNIGLPRRVGRQPAIFRDYT